MLFVTALSNGFRRAKANLHTQGQQAAGPGNHGKKSSCRLCLVQSQHGHKAVVNQLVGFIGSTGGSSCGCLSGFAGSRSAS